MMWCGLLFAILQVAVDNVADGSPALGEPVCGVAESAMPDYLARWPSECRDLRLYCDFSGLRGLDASEFRSVAAKACRNCSLVSGLSITLTDNASAADVYLKAGAMRGGILAWCEFPSECGRVVQTRFNSGVNWSEELFLDTLVHELGHGFGLPHTSDRRDIMFPSIVSGRALDGMYGPFFSKPAMVERYGPFRFRPSPVVGLIGLWRVLAVVLAFVVGVLLGAFFLPVIRSRLPSWLGGG